MKIQQYKATNVTKVTQTENSRNPDTLEMKVPQTSYASQYAPIPLQVDL